MTEEAVVVTRADAALLDWVLDLLDVDILEEQREMMLKQFARFRQNAEARGAKGIDVAPALKRVADALGLAIKTVERRHNRLRVLLDDDDGAQSHE